MSNVMIGGIPDFYMYFIRSSTFRGGKQSVDKHQPFNPIVASAGIKMPEEASLREAYGKTLVELQ